jgi:hypothetical protein
MVNGEALGRVLTERQALNELGSDSADSAAYKALTESLILAQDERWRRA